MLDGNARRSIAQQHYASLLTSGDPQLIHDNIVGLPEADRKAIVDSIFWIALRERDWKIAAICHQAESSVTSPSKDRFSPLYDAMSGLGDCPDVIEWLLGHGADIEYRSHNNWTPLHAAIAGRHMGTIRTLLDHGADVTSGTVIDDDDTPLLMAVSAGDEELVELLLDYGADPLRPNRFGDTPLQRAVLKDNPAIATMCRNRPRQRAASSRKES